MTKLPIFYWRESFDSFLAAMVAKKFLPPVAEVMPLFDGDEVPNLDGCFPVFVGVEFTRLKEFPDMSKCGNCAIVARRDQASTILGSFSKLPHKPVPKYPNPLRGRIFVNDFEILSELAFSMFVADKSKRTEMLPNFVKYVNMAMQNPDPLSKERKILAALEKDDSYLMADAVAFEQRIMVPFDRKRQDMLTSLEEAGEKLISNEQRMVAAMLERNTVLTNFAGHQVKLAHIPQEFSKQAGAILAHGMPFGVVIEDRYAEGCRVYHLYSTPAGLDVAEVAKQYKAVGSARYATFTAKIDFTNHKFI